MFEIVNHSAAGAQIAKASGRPTLGRAPFRTLPSAMTTTPSSAVGTIAFIIVGHCELACASATIGRLDDPVRITARRLASVGAQVF